MITKCMLRTGGGGGNSEVNFASGGGSEFSDSSSSVSIDEIVANPCITGRSRFFHTSADSLFNGEPMVTLMEASDDGEDLQGTYFMAMYFPFPAYLSYLKDLWSISSRNKISGTFNN